MIMEKQKQSQLIQQSQQLLQYMISSQLPSTSPHPTHPPMSMALPLSSAAMPARGGPMASPGSPAGYYATQLPGSALPPLQLARPTTPTNATPPPASGVSRTSNADRDKRRRSTSSVQNIW